MNPLSDPSDPSDRSYPPFDMGDFLLDLRKAEERRLNQAAAFLRFYPDMRVEVFEHPGFALSLTSADDPKLWGPYAPPDGSLLAALCGRIALDQKQWDEAAKVEGPGGLACKFIYKTYLQLGLGGIEGLSGNFVVVLYDRSARKLFVVTDRWGLLPAFRFDRGGRHRVYCSHPDALADAVGESRNWDPTSFAELILTGRLSAPYTYYQRIRALPVASTVSISLGGDAEPPHPGPLPWDGRGEAIGGDADCDTRGRVCSPRSDGGEPVEETRRYFQFDAQPQPEDKLDELAEQFAAAFKQAAAKRTLPLLGQSAVGLSGGLDSRTVLCACPNRQDVLAFSFYDEETPEFRIARSIADEAGVKFIPLKRTFDYYADHAALGVKISAGMGCIASNHFLGFRRQLQDLGINNLLTGCYCDYLFKGLALNKRVNRLTTRERLGRYDFSYYAAHFRSDTESGAAVRQRLEELFPSDLRRYDSTRAVLGVEQRRLFPLCYEEDNAERTIPQRTMGWYVPIADNELMEVHLKMSCAMKLNRRLFGRMVERVCGEKISELPDANTGAPVNASRFRQALSGHLRRLEEVYRKLLSSNSATGSWVNWAFYINHSKKVRALWESANADAEVVFRQVLGKDEFSKDIATYRGRRLGIFLQLLTLKLWFDQRGQ